MTLEEAIADLERGRTVVDGIPMAICETGEGYFEFMSGYEDPKDEVYGRVKTIFLTEEGAIKDWHRQVMEYSSGSPGVLYYRVRPEKSWDSDWKRSVIVRGSGGQEEIIGSPFQVYCRILISDKPPLHTREEWEAAQVEDRARQLRKLEDPPI